jgi:hypothetical protein
MKISAIEDDNVIDFDDLEDIKLSKLNSHNDESIIIYLFHIIYLSIYVSKFHSNISIYLSISLCIYL